MGIGAVNDAIGSSIADPAVHRTVQPIYIAAPIPAGQADFLPVRCGLRAREIDEVEVPGEPARTRYNTAATQRGEGLFAESLDAALELMGDPPEFPDGQGFYAPIDAAFKAATRDFGSELDLEAPTWIGEYATPGLGWSRRPRNAKHAGRLWRRPDRDCPPTFG